MATYSITDAPAVVEGDSLLFTVTGDDIPPFSFIGIGDSVTTDHGIVSIPAFSTTGSLPVPTVNNTTFGPNPDVTVKLTSTGFGSINPTANTAIGHVTDDETAPVYSITDAPAVVEGGKLLFTVTGTTAAGSNVTVNTDWGDVLIMAGLTTGTLDVRTQDNTTFGSNPDVTATLTGTSLGSINPTAKTAIGHVTENDPAPVYSITDAAAVVEGGKLLFTVTGTTAGGSDVTVTTDQGDVTIKAGQTTGTLEVPTLDNTIFGPNPDVAVALTGTSLGTIAPAAKTAIGHVTDNDTAPVYSIANAADVVEGGKLLFTVTGTTSVGSQDITVTTDQGNVLIKAGQTTGTLEVPTQDNTTFGPNPDVTVALTGTNFGSIDPAAKPAIGHVTDNDTALNPVYRFFDTKTQDHFYTTSAGEKDQILKTQPSYNFEGAQWATPDKGAGTVDVFRFFDSAHGSHFFTTSVAERDFVKQTQPNYVDEGVAFEAYANAGEAGSGALTLERFFNTNTQLHHYSASASETNGINQGAAGPGWIDEGPGFIVHVPTGGMLNA